MGVPKRRAPPKPPEKEPLEQPGEPQKLTWAGAASASLAADRYSGSEQKECWRDGQMQASEGPWDQVLLPTTGHEGALKQPV